MKSIDQWKLAVENVEQPTTQSLVLREKRGREPASASLSAGTARDERVL